MASHEAKVMAYSAFRDSYAQRAFSAISDLREELDKAERRLTSDEPVDRQLVSSSATSVLRSASSLHEVAFALEALERVSFFVAGDAGNTSPRKSE